MFEKEIIIRLFNFLENNFFSNILKKKEINEIRFTINKRLKIDTLLCVSFEKVYLSECIVFEKKKLFDPILKDYSILKGDQISFGP